MFRTEWKIGSSISLLDWQEWNAQRELHLQNRLLCLLGGCLSIEGDLTEFAKPRGRALERFRDKEKEALAARNA